jgi:hypothetical protein
LLPWTNLPARAQAGEPNRRANTCGCPSTPNPRPRRSSAGPFGSGWRRRPGIDDVVIAVNEACTNAIEHAYPPDEPGHVTIDGLLTRVGDEREVTLVVRDRGRWRPAPAAAGFRGHGITMMRGGMRSVGIEPTPHGATLTLISFAVPDRIDER